MPVVTVQVKWGKKLLEDVQLDTDGTVEDFKAVIYSLTGVPVDRQKLMAKGIWRGILKPDMALSDMTLADGAKLTLIGTSAGIPSGPTQEVKFVEDMAPGEVAKAGIAVPAGLINVGNTCYANSTLQCLRGTPELRRAVVEAGNSTSDNLTAALGQLFLQMDHSTAAVLPASFVAVMHATAPHLAERDARGRLRQQDADDFQNVVFQSLSGSLTRPVGIESLGRASNLLDALFGVDMETRYKCLESEDEPEVVREEHARKLVCNISGGGGSEAQINNVRDGILLGLESPVEKRSEVLGRNAQWRETRRISQLSRCLCVQFMRFYWKETPQSRDQAGVKCKIMRPVSFPAVLDAYDFCADALQKRLKVFRDRHAAKLLASGPGAVAGAAAGMEEEEEDDEVAEAAAAGAAAGANDDEAEELRRATALSMGEDAAAGAAGAAGEEVGPGLPKGFRGLYEVYAVVTHKGRSADGGHYIGWVRQEGDEWMCFDDDSVSPCRTEDVMRLKGGGDYDMAYMAYYRAKE